MPCWALSSAARMQGRSPKTRGAGTGRAFGRGGLRPSACPFNGRGSGIASVRRRTRAVLPCLAAVLFAFLFSACSSGPAPLGACTPGMPAADGLTAVCGFQNPEDLAALPGDAWLIVSQLPTPSAPGNLLALSTLDDTRHVLWPPVPENADAVAPQDAGDDACPGPPDPAQFSPHGLDLGADGRRLYVVNHGSREAVEFFTLAPAGDGVAPSLQWNGCAEVPEAFDANLNDVAATPTGFVTTKMLPAGALHAPVSLLLGLEAGALLTWSEASGWARVPGSRGFAPNGVAAAQDGSRFFFAEWGAQRIVRVQSDGSGRKASAPLGFFPDNLTWTASGDLLAAGQVGSLFDTAPCLTLETGNCGMGVRVVRIDPETLDVEVLVDHNPAVVVGGVSVALEHAGRLWLGVFGGDRLAHQEGP